VIAQIVSAQTELKCWYGNKTYAVGESIPEATTDNPCSMGCFCSGSSPGKPPRITCATVDCQPFPDQDDCVPTHKEGSCCPEYYCPQRKLFLNDLDESGDGNPCSDHKISGVISIT